jgi:DNA-binding SARP family transcriptional activator
VPTDISVQTLGVVAIDVNDSRVRPSAGQLFALLLYLASRRGHATSRRAIQELIFPNATERQGAHNLRQLLYRARRLGAPIEMDSDELRAPIDRVSIDWWEVVNDPELGKSQLEDVARGVFPGYAPAISDAFREWFEGERAEASLQLSRAVATRLTQLRRAGRWDLVDAASRALLAIDPFSEEGTLAKAEVLAVAGSKSAALHVIDEYLREVGVNQPQLRLAPSSLRRRISERLPDLGQRSLDDRVFVGREEMMNALSAMGAAARAGSEQVLLVWGEPGIGKTRLLTEYRALSALEGGVACWHSCQSHDVFRPLGILTDLASELLQAPGSLGCDPGARELLARLVSANDHVGVQREHEAEEAPLSAIVRSLSDLVSAVATERPVLVFIDDAQWLDRSSLTALLGAFGGRSARRSCLVMASRERALLSGADTHFDRVSSIRLKPLDHEPARELARAHLQAALAAEMATVEGHILEQAKGNPFFIRFLCSHFTATSDIQTLTESLGEILERRLEQLSPDATRTLEACVVLGKNCTFARLEGLLQVPRYRLIRDIEELDDRGLVEIRDGCFVSSHALLGDAVVRRMSAVVESVFHAAAADLLQKEGAAAWAGSLPWDCAEHWRRAGRDEEAVSVLRACAQRAVDVGRYGDAVATLQRALTLNVRDETRLEIVEDALNAIRIHSNHAEVPALIRERQSLRGRLGMQLHPHDNFELLELAMSRYSDVDLSIFSRRLRGCLTATDATPAHKLNAACQLLILAELLLDADLAHFVSEQIIDLEPGVGRRVICDMIYHAIFGSPEKGAVLARELVRLCLGDLPRKLGLLFNAGYTLYRVGSIGEAEQTLTLAFDAAERYGASSCEVNGVLSFARMYWGLERFDEFRTWMQTAADLQSRRPDPQVDVDYYVLAARDATRCGRYDEAREFIRQARQSPESRLDLDRLYLLACDVEVGLALGIPPSADELDALLSLHLRARGTGCQDDVMTAVLHALDAVGRSAEAAKLLQSYVTTYRRDRFPVRSELAERCGSWSKQSSRQSHRIVALESEPRVHG